MAESDHGEIGLMDLEQPGRLLADGSLVIPEMGFVGRPDLPENRPGSGHHLGDAERAADLDQLAPADDHFLALGQSVQGDQDGGGVVVDHQSRLGPGQLLEQPDHMAVAGAPLTRGQIVFQVAVGPGQLGDGLEGRFGQERPAQVGVNHHPGGVDSSAQAGPVGLLGQIQGPIGQAVQAQIDRPVGGQFFPGQVDRLPGRPLD